MPNYNGKDNVTKVSYEMTYYFRGIWDIEVYIRELKNNIRISYFPTDDTEDILVFYVPHGTSNEEAYKRFREFMEDYPEFVL